MNTGFDENETEFRVFVFSITFEVLANGDSLEDWILVISLYAMEAKIGKHDNIPS